jgi:hypothetical protein
MIYQNFRIAVWLSILASIGMLFLINPSDVGITKGVPRPPVGLGIFSAVQCLLWFIWYRHEEGHAVAGIMGFFLAVDLVIGLIHGNWPAAVFYLYLSVSHLIYALSGWRLTPPNVTDL